MRNEGETLRGGPPAGVGGRNATGAGGGVNVNWDGSWEVKTRVTETGWTAEFAIPLAHAALRPAAADLGRELLAQHRAEARAGLLVARVAHLHAGAPVVGRRAARPGRAGAARLQADAVRDLARRTGISRALPKPTYDQTGDWGVDGKIGVTSSTTLDLTYNTDFAQVEVDEQQINLTRFNLLFPEKRPFFLENRGLFAVGRPGEIDLFFSRRIGIDDSGHAPPDSGRRAADGKAAASMSVCSTCRPSSVGDTPANNFTAARVNKDLRNRSSLGAMFVNREGTGEPRGTRQLQPDL